MTSLLKNVDKNISKVIREAAQEADFLNLPVYLVGGFVRDIILKKKDFDIDLVVEGDAHILAHNLSKRFNATLTFIKNSGQPR